MAIFFLYVGIEIKEEILHGHLSSIKKASFPIIAALGGVIVPAIIFTLFNVNTEFSHGVGVPISTDIAFAIGIFTLLKNKINPSLKIFLLSLAVVDDLVSILVIATMYSSNINFNLLILAIITLAILAYMKKNNVESLLAYIIGGIAIWYFIYASGVHATISGVLLATVIPYDKIKHKLEEVSNIIILPLFALVNTAITFTPSQDMHTSDNMIFGIITGLVIGKPLGIMLFTYIGTKIHLIEKPRSCKWIEVLCVSLLAGIGFTMSIFVAEIAFGYNENIVNIAKTSILVAAIMSIALTYIFSNFVYLYRKNHGFGLKKVV